MTLTELSVAARMNGMSYGQFVYALKGGQVIMPPKEEIRSQMIMPKIERYAADVNRAICQYDLNGEFICSYENVYKAAEALGKENASSIKAALSGRYQSAHKFQWRYMDEPAPGVLKREMVNPYDPKYWVKKPCKRCGEVYNGPKNTRYCSDECKTKAQQEQNKEKYLKNRVLWQPQERICPYCGVKFMPKEYKQQYCCAAHRKAAAWQKTKAKKAQNRK